MQKVIQILPRALIYMQQREENSVDHNVFSHLDPVLKNIGAVSHVVILGNAQTPLPYGMEQFTFLLLIATYCQYYRDPDRLCVAFPLDISLIVGSQGLIQIQEPSFHSGFPIFSLRTSLHYQTIVRTRRPKRLTNGLQAKPSHFLLCK